MIDLTLAICAIVLLATQIIRVRAEETQPIGIWGRRHLRCLKEHRKAVYVGLCASGKLNSYLADIDRQAKEQLEMLTEQMKRSVRQHGIKQQL